MRLCDRSKILITRIVYSFIVIFSVVLGGALFSLARAQNDHQSGHVCPSDLTSRFGINVHRDSGATKNLHMYPHQDMNFGWYTDYHHVKPSLSPDGITYVHMVKPLWVQIETISQQLGPQLAENPGATWLVGNEPDNVGQDGFYLESAGAYAAYYHNVYSFIKATDPTAQVTIAGVVQPSPLRLKYLDQVLLEYESQFRKRLPMDFMNVHNFVMSERATPGEDIVLWGNGAPPGMDADDPNVRYIAPEAHWNIDLFKQQIYDVRFWMSDNGYADMALIVSEYGILLPDEWDLNQVGTANFMADSFDFFLTERNEELGYSEDDYRLVQAFGWFSLNYPPYATIEGEGLNGALFELESREITSLGEAYKDYIHNYIAECNPSSTPESTLTPIAQLTLTSTPMVGQTETPTPSNTSTALAATQLPTGDVPLSGPTVGSTPRPLETPAIGAGDLNFNLYMPFR